MNLLLASPAASASPSSTSRARSRALLTSAAIASLLLVGCTVEEDPESPSSESGSQAAPGSQEPSSEAPEDAATSDAGSDATQESSSEAESETGAGTELPDPDEMDLERTDELGAYLSEEEACMSVGSMIDGLRTDMNQGVEEQDVLDEVYLAVEQTYILVPNDLREPMENILQLLDTDVADLDEEEVLVAAEPVDGWLTVDFCEGDYHNQSHSDDGAQN